MFSGLNDELLGFKDIKMRSIVVEKTMQLVCKGLLSTRDFLIHFTQLLHK